MGFNVKKDAQVVNGKTIVISGGNSGIGFEAARIFAKNGAKLVLACRNVGRGEGAVKRLSDEFPESSIEFMQLDLGSLKSVAAFAEKFNKEKGLLDILVNNAGVMAFPKKEVTEDGFEAQVGVNVFGHFALTAQLMPSLLKSQDARIVNVSSEAHYLTRSIDFSNYSAEKSYNKWRQYGYSKTGNILFTHKLDKKLKECGISNVKVVSCHPGYSNTNLQQHSGFFSKLNYIAAQSAYMGSLPTVMAAVADVKGGEFVGPRVLGWFGNPKFETPGKHTFKEDLQNGLWEVCEESTNVKFDLTPVQVANSAL